MGLRETIQAAVKAGLQATGNVRETVTYLSYAAASAYNPSTGTMTRSETSYTVLGVLDRYKNSEVDGQQIKPKDQSCILVASELAFTPSMNDRIEREDGSVWEVIDVQTDPVQATWTLQVRSQ